MVITKHEARVRSVDLLGDLHHLLGIERVLVVLQRGHIVHRHVHAVFVRSAARGVSTEPVQDEIEPSREAARPFATTLLERLVIPSQLLAFIWVVMGDAQEFGYILAFLQPAVAHLWLVL